MLEIKKKSLTVESFSLVSFEAIKQFWRICSAKLNIRFGRRKKKTIQGKEKMNFMIIIVIKVDKLTFQNIKLRNKCYF